LVILYLKKGNVVHFKILFLICILSINIYAKPIIYFIISNNCTYCRGLITDVNSNQKLIQFLNTHYIAKTIVTSKQKVPKHLPFKGKVPTMIIENDGQIVGDAISGQIPSYELLDYLTKIKESIQTKKRTYYAY